MELNQIFYEDKYSEAVHFANENNYKIIEKEKVSGKRTFQVVENLISEYDEKILKIFKLKEQLKKYKEDVEQVELFDMTREDYEEKKLNCKEIILELRVLEKGD